MSSVDDEYTFEQLKAFAEGMAGAQPLHPQTRRLIEAVRKTRAVEEPRWLVPGVEVGRVGPVFVEGPIKQVSKEAEVAVADGLQLNGYHPSAMDSESCQDKPKS